MISIIICSVNPTFLAQLSENINDTIGVPYEIIATDNRGTGKGICQVYNEGIQRAQFEVICLVHEDIIIKTQNWGKVLLSIFDDETIGLAGIAGSSYRPLAPANWGSHGVMDTIYTNIIQTFKLKEQKALHDYINPWSEKLSQVTCVDGVWLATTKSVASKINFDENTFKAFHGYDIDFSMAVGQYYKVVVTFEILINHLSEGSFDKTWMRDNLKLFFKWNKKLPLIVRDEKPRKVIIHTEKVVFKRFLDQLIEFGFPAKVALKVLGANNSFWKLSPKLYLKLLFYTFKKYMVAGKPASHTTH